MSDKPHTYPSHALCDEVSAAYQADHLTFMSTEQVCIATVVVPQAKDHDYDQVLWATFVRHRNALARKGFRLTGPLFEDCGFGAMVERIPSQ